MRSKRLQEEVFSLVERGRHLVLAVAVVSSMVERGRRLVLAVAVVSSAATIVERGRRLVLAVAVVSSAATIVERAHQKSLAVAMGSSASTTVQSLHSSGVRPGHYTVGPSSLSLTQVCVFSPSARLPNPPWPLARLALLQLVVLLLRRLALLLA